jgi:hypothetical protein
MSDERLRELERRWKETGSVEDEAKYLAERVRVGDLTLGNEEHVEGRFGLLWRGRSQPELAVRQKVELNPRAITLEPKSSASVRQALFSL